TSRSMRVSTRNEPKISARSLTPIAKVPAKSATLLYPWMKFVPPRYPLTDHLPFASTSPVGTYHNPVSPKNVVVAGRVSAGAVDEGEVWVVEELCPCDVPEAPL